MRTNNARRFDEQRERDIEKAAAMFSQHFMSNAKWVGLIEQLVKHVDAVKKIEFKKTQTEQLGELYLDKDTSFGFDFWEEGFEEHNSLGGVLGFNEIEYLVFPKFVDADKTKQQDLNLIVDLVNSIGEFVLEQDENCVRLIAYRK